MDILPNFYALIIKIIEESGSKTNKIMVDSDALITNHKGSNKARVSKRGSSSRCYYCKKRGYKRSECPHRLEDAKGNE